MSPTTRIEPVRVLLTSTSYPASAEDWQGRFIANMAKALAQREDVSLALWAPPGDLPEKTVAATTQADNNFLERLSKQGGIAHLLRTRKAMALGIAMELLFRQRRALRKNKPDVAHINWLQNALPLWATTTPALITVLGTDFALLRLPGMKLALRSVLRQRRVILAPNAEWMANELERSFGDLAEVRPIPFGVDNPWFEVVRPPSPANRPRWLAVTRLTRNKIGDLFSWGEGLFGENRQLHLFGPMQEQVSIPDWVKYHGPTHPAELLHNWFPRATGLITLSRHDEGRPQVMLEAMAAGLPVIASDLPAHRNLITHGQNGWIVPTPDALAEALTRLEDSGANQSLGTGARRWVKERIGNWDDCAERYVQAYRDLLETA